MSQQFLTYFQSERTRLDAAADLRAPKPIEHGDARRLAQLQAAVSRQIRAWQADLEQRVA